MQSLAFGTREVIFKRSYVLIKKEEQLLKRLSLAFIYLFFRFRGKKFLSLTMSFMKLLWADFFTAFNLKVPFVCLKLSKLIFFKKFLRPKEYDL